MENKNITWNKQKVWDEIENNLTVKKLPVWVYYLAATIIIVLLINIFHVHRFNKYSLTNNIDTIFISDTIIRTEIEKKTICKTEEKIIYKEKIKHDTILEYKYFTITDTIFVKTAEYLAVNDSNSNKTIQNEITFSKYNFMQQTNNNSKNRKIKFRFRNQEVIKHNEKYLTQNKQSFFKTKIILN